MGLVDDPCIGPRGADRLQQCDVGPDVHRPAGDGGIGLDLPRHQDDRAGMVRPAPCDSSEVVFGQPGLDDPLPQLRRACEVIGVRGVADEQVLQRAGPAGVVIDANLVQHPRQRPGQVRAEPDRAQEAVLQPHYPQPLRHAGGQRRRPPQQQARARRNGSALAHEAHVGAPGEAAHQRPLAPRKPMREQRLAGAQAGARQFHCSRSSSDSTRSKCRSQVGTWKAAMRASCSARRGLHGIENCSIARIQPTPSRPST